jgi:hypothetical protein
MRSGRRVRHSDGPLARWATDSVRFSRPVVGAVAASLAILAFGFAGATAASADVCTGGAPYEASGSPEASVTALVPFLGSPRWSKEELPSWEAERASVSWGNQLAYAWYRYTRLWGATSTAAWWVVPGVGCDVKGESERFGTAQAGAPYAEYPPEVCVLLYVKLSMESANCQDAKQLSASNPPVEVELGGQRLVSGFAPPDTGSVEVHFSNGSTTFPVAGGVYGGSVNALLGKALAVTGLQPTAKRTPAPVVLVDQTGLFTSFRASRPRMSSVAARIHRRITSVRALNLGHAVVGQRARDSVLYAPGSRALASRVARALHAHDTGSLGRGELKMFGSVAQVVVFVGRTD